MGQNAYELTECPFCQGKEGFYFKERCSGIVEYSLPWQLGRMPETEINLIGLKVTKRYKYLYCIECKKVVGHIDDSYKFEPSPTGDGILGGYVKKEKEL